MFNTTPHSITRYSPYELLFGRRCNLPGEVEQEVQPLYNYDDIVKVIKHRLQESHHIAQKNLMKFKEQQQVKTQNNEFNKDIKINDLILVKKGQRKHKLDSIWEGPYEVKELKYPNVVIQRIGKRKHEKVHMNQVKALHFYSKTKMKLLRLWAISSMMILWRRVQTQQTEPLTSETNIYFDEVGTISFYPMTWKVVSYLNLQPTRDLWRKVKTHYKQVALYCQNLENTTWYHYTDCEFFKRYISPKAKYIDNMKELVIEYLKPD
jgi:hypothetical protein